MTDALRNLVPFRVGAQREDAVTCAMDGHDPGDEDRRPGWDVGDIFDVGVLIERLQNPRRAAWMSKESGALADRLLAEHRDARRRTPESAR